MARLDIRPLGSKCFSYQELVGQPGVIQSRYAKDKANNVLTLLKAARPDLSASFQQLKELVDKHAKLDYASNCAAFAYLCGNATYEEVLRTRCQVTCGFCSGCEFHANGIVPRFMQLAPSRRLNVTFAGGARVDCGNTLTLDQQAGDAPAITWDVQAGALYTFIMMGPEFTPAGMPQNTLNLHWLKVDIPANNLAGGRTLADYQRAVPPPNAGLQPFVFVVYRQAGNVADQMFGDRTNFSATTFASTRNLGYPYAGNYFRMQLA
ncbi:unnamed protein product [Toxocara canis]|uniref:ShKT domain-containing protein n=1 Tax=Toxocara canis TaxID=6265 RepID=A0A183TYL8_TOXCA|nr:unnamed protein product [Toxocara canis]